MIGRPIDSLRTSLVNLGFPVPEAPSCPSFSKTESLLSSFSGFSFVCDCSFADGLSIWKIMDQRKCPPNDISGNFRCTCLYQCITTILIFPKAKKIFKKLTQNITTELLKELTVPSILNWAFPMFLKSAVLSTFKTYFDDKLMIYGYEVRKILKTSVP